MLLTVQSSARTLWLVNEKIRLSFFAFFLSFLLFCHFGVVVESAKNMPPGNNKVLKYCCISEKKYGIQCLCNFFDSRVAPFFVSC